LRKTLFYISIFVIYLNYSCNNEERQAEIKSAELIYSLVKNELNKTDKIFLTQKPVAVERSKFDISDNEIQEILGIKDSTIYWNQVKIQSEFSLTKKMIPNNAELLTQMKNGTELTDLNYKNSLLKKCQGRFTSITRPIYNRNLTLAFIEYGYYCGTNCQGNKGLLYEYKNSKWNFRKVVYSWDK
jgi:hypothetical protein